MQDIREFERVYEQQDVKKGADERYWESEKEARNKSLDRLYNYPFSHFVERVDEAFVLGEQYEMLLDKPIGYYLMTIARTRYLKTVKTE